MMWPACVRGDAIAHQVQDIPVGILEPTFMP